MKTSLPHKRTFADSAYFALLVLVMFAIMGFAILV